MLDALKASVETHITSSVLMTLSDLQPTSASSRIATMPLKSSGSSSFKQKALSRCILFPAFSISIDPDGYFGFVDMISRTFGNIVFEICIVLIPSPLIFSLLTFGNGVSLSRFFRYICSMSPKSTSSACGFT